MIEGVREGEIERDRETDQKTSTYNKKQSQIGRYTFTRATYLTTLSHKLTNARVFLILDLASSRPLFLPFDSPSLSISISLNVAYGVIGASTLAPSNPASS